MQAGILGKVALVTGANRGIGRGIAVALARIGVDVAVNYRSQDDELAAKVVCSEAAVRVTQDVMTIFGGTAFASRLPFERYFRDARAGMVMGMANDAAYQNMVPLLFPDRP